MKHTVLNKMTINITFMAPVFSRLDYGSATLDRLPNQLRDRVGVIFSSTSMENKVEIMLFSVPVPNPSPITLA